MAVVTVGIRELKARLSKYMQRVQEGETVIITERGKPVGQIIPISSAPEQKLADLQQAGLVMWNGRKLPPYRPTVRARGKKTVADLLIEDRE